MAIQYKEILNKSQDSDSAPFTEAELGFISEVETYIDKEIEKLFNTDNKTIRILLSIADFTTRTYAVHGKYPSMTSRRKQHLREELARIYQEAGWETSVELGEFSEPDCFVLKGKQ